jgi:predicted phage baseplate assembly protein
VSNGAPLQEYVLMSQGAIQRTVRVWVQETDGGTIEWSYVDHLIDSGPDASVYTTYLDDQRFLHAVFGDNTSGRIPPNGAQISASYRYGVGAMGNVAAGTIVQITKPIPGVTVNNALSTTGGADNESIDSMRRSIPKAARIKDRAVTLQDFGDLAYAVPGVAKATAQGQYYTQVKVYIAPVGGGYPSADLLNQVYVYLGQRSLVGTTIEMHPTDAATDPIYTNVVVDITVHVQSQYGQLTVTNAVTDAITNLLSFDSADFGGLVTQGAIYHACMQVPGVDWIVLNKLIALDDSGNPVGTAQISDLQMAPTRIPALTSANLTITGVGGLT